MISRQDENEICTLYREAAKPEEQVFILSQLYATSTLEIRKILIKNDKYKLNRNTVEKIEKQLNRGITESQLHAYVQELKGCKRDEITRLMCDMRIPGWELSMECETISTPKAKQSITISMDNIANSHKKIAGSCENLQEPKDLPKKSEVKPIPESVRAALSARLGMISEWQRPLLETLAEINEKLSRLEKEAEEIKAFLEG